MSTSRVRSARMLRRVVVAASPTVEATSWRAPVRDLGLHSGQPVADRREGRDDAVVQVGGDPAALVVGGVQGPAVQAGALPLAVLQPAGQPERQRQLQQLQRDEGQQQRRGEGAPDSATVGDHRVVAQVGLEQQRRAAGVVTRR